VIEQMGDSEYEGITKTMTFGDTGQVETGDVSVFVIKDAVVREVGPVGDL
jgi:hypothetical protein